MKTKLTLLVLIIFNYSYAQFFEDELDYLVFDKQDSLIKSNNVKIKRLKSIRFLDGKEERSNNAKKYSKRNEDRLGVTYKYDDKGRVINKYFKLPMKKGSNHKKVSNSFQRGNFTKGSFPLKEISYHYYDSGKLQYVIETYADDNNIGIGLVKKTKYSNDTILITETNSQNNLIYKKEIISSKDREKITWNNKSGNINIKESFFDKEKSTVYVDQKEHRPKGFFHARTEYSINEKRLPSKKNYFSIYSVENKEIKRKIVSFFIYNSHKELIGIKTSVNGMPKTLFTSAFDYYENGLLKSITKKEQDKETKEENIISIKEYEYKFF